MTFSGCGSYRKDIYESDHGLITINHDLINI